MKTLQEMKDSGYLELGQVYILPYYTYHCKKILGMNMKYKKKHYKLIKFKSLGDDDFFRYDVLFNSNNNYNPFFCSSSCTCGQKVELDLFKYNERILKRLKLSRK